MNLRNPKGIVIRVVTDRKFIFISLVLALILLSVYYESNYEQHLEYPDTSIILKDYPVGQTVSVSGNVREVYNNSFILSDIYHNIEVNYTVYSPEKVSIGDNVEVLGVLGNSYNISASKILVVSAFDYHFMIFRSAVILLIFIYFSDVTGALTFKKWYFGG